MREDETSSEFGYETLACSGALSDVSTEGGTSVQAPRFSASARRNFIESFNCFRNAMV